MTVAQGILPFKLIPDTEQSMVTSFASLPLVIETMRVLKFPHAVRELLHIKKRGSGFYAENDYVESFISFFAKGGTRLDDFTRVQADKGLKKLGLSIPSSESARLFLYVFHEEEFLKDRPQKGAFVPPETEPLKNLFSLQKQIIAKTDDRPTSAAIDGDATVIESNKAQS
jgi:hypothetical protein